ncbi:phosphotransferase [Micromonospora sediminicola]|uniref:phosphotransferase n=1 Tax=Micromonospora sediminicola TaxID=946078 RepID=UPI000AA4EF87|nr:phosphotransferase [Micromonospora sediminicola]
MVEIDAALVRTLVAAQFPQWAHLPVTAVTRQGWDNRTFRIGDDLLVRLPSAEGYASAIAKEDHCLPILARHLPLPAPEPVATGAPR